MIAPGFGIDAAILSPRERQVFISRQAMQSRFFGFATDVNGKHVKRERPKGMTTR
jgi:hypothetical protein